MKSVAESIRDLQNRLAMIETASPAEAGAEAAGGMPEPEPATGAESSLAKKLEQVGGKLMEKDGRQFMVLADKGLAVEVPSMEVVDASTPELKGTGKTFDPAEFGLNEGMDLEEGFWDSLVRGAMNLGTGAKMMGKNLAAGLRGDPGAVAPTGAMLGKTGSAATQMQKVMPGSKAAFNTGKALKGAGTAMKNNPVKTGLGVAGAGLAGGYLTGAHGNTPVGSANPTGAGGGAGGTTAPAGNTEQDDAELADLKKQIDALMAELSTSQDPAIQKGLADIKTKLGS
jgi:hypothetical protein